MNFGAVISKHRRSIMGFAALMIVCRHAYWTSGFRLWNFFINNYGNAGVDFFVFLAGFGLAFSLEKKPAFHHYYARRLERILPVYYVAIVAKLITHIAAGSLTLNWFIASFIPLGVWINATPQFWYVSATLGYYLIAPLIFHVFKNARFPRLTMITLVILSGVLVPIVSNIEPMAIMRISTLIIGVGIGTFQTVHLSRKERLLDISLLVVFFVCGLLILRDSALFDLPFLNLVHRGKPHYLWKGLTVPLATIALGFTFELTGRTPLRFINALLDKLGQYSYEIYIGHLIVMYFAMDLFGLSGLGLLIFMLSFSYPTALLLSFCGKKLLAAAKKIPLFKPSEE